MTIAPAGSGFTRRVRLGRRIIARTPAALPVPILPMPVLRFLLVRGYAHGAGVGRRLDPAVADSWIGQFSRRGDLRDATGLVARVLHEIDAVRELPVPAYPVLMVWGTLFGVAEVLGGVICVPSFDLARFSPTVKALTIDFRRPATTAVRAEASLTEEAIARIRDLAEATGKAEFVLDAVIADAGGEVVATTTGTYQLRATGPARA